MDDFDAREEEDWDRYALLEDDSAFYIEETPDDGS